MPKKKQKKQSKQKRRKQGDRKAREQPKFSRPLSEVEMTARAEKRAYDESEELTRIENRYQYARDNLQFTLPVLRRNRDFMEVYGRLREKGWKDWHVLLAIGNVAHQYRSKEAGRDMVSQEEMKSEKAFKDFQKKSYEDFFKPETQSGARPPPEVFTDEAMERALDMATASFLQGHGWEMKNPTPHFRAMRKFATERYRFFDLDVEHEEFFGTP